MRKWEKQSEENQNKVIEYIDNAITSEAGKEILVEAKWFVENKGNSYEQPLLYKNLMDQFATLEAKEAGDLKSYLENYCLDPRSVEG